MVVHPESASAALLARRSVFKSDLHDWIGCAFDRRSADEKSYMKAAEPSTTSMISRPANA
jgi:hypothetical protein